MKKINSKIVSKSIFELQKENFEKIKKNSKEKGSKNIFIKKLEFENIYSKTIKKIIFFLFFFIFLYI